MVDYKKLILRFIAAAILIIGIGIAIHYYTSTHSVTVEFTDVHSVEVTKLNDDKSHTVATIAKSGDSTRLANDTDYTVRYKGGEGFADGVIKLTRDMNRLTITPDYSAAKNATLMSQAFPVAHALIASKYPNVDSLYTLTSSSMLERGKWYLLKLTYNGEYDYNSDNLKILLEKKGDGWQLVTKPDILFTTANYPSLPADVLSWADSL